ncbi:hypothetical protein HYU07_07410 [Candidatus Woesearchaeota archaeon]|nr:hypothetical protein [Candidatus Woesearchaeota archaeon]
MGKKIVISIVTIAIFIVLIITAFSWYLSLHSEKLSLVKVNTYDVTPKTNEPLKSWRPEIQKIGDKFYYAFNTGERFALVILDENFNQEGYLNLFSGDNAGYFPTDIRTSRDDKGNFWYAFENARRNKTALIEKCEQEKRCDINKNGIAIYSAISLIKIKTEAISGCVTSPELIQLVGENCFKGKHASDDPTPFFHNGRYYVLRRSHFSPVQNIIEYDSEFNELNRYIIDLSSFIGDNGVSQNTVVEIDGKLYLIGGVGIGKPIAPDSASSIYAFELAYDLNSASNSIKLTNYAGEFNTRVTSARYKDGILYITYLNNHQDDFSMYLEAFDVKNNFASLSRVRAFDWRENNIEVSGDKIYVAYVGDDYRLYLAEFEWRKGGSESEQTTNQVNAKQTLKQQNKDQTHPYCGDGICGPVEKEKGICPQDCQ